MHYANEHAHNYRKTNVGKCVVRSFPFRLTVSVSQQTAEVKKPGFILHLRCH